MEVDSRAVHLGAVFIRGLTTLLMANSACGFPFRMDDLMPWKVFDGKLFQEKYQRSHRSCSVEELLEGNVSNYILLDSSVFLLKKSYLSIFIYINLNVVTFFVSFLCIFPLLIFPVSSFSPT